jgi:hypothetical protein
MYAEILALPVQERTVDGACPFCAAGWGLLLELTRGLYLVQCSNSGCSAQGPCGRSPALAVEGWQSRGGLSWRACPVCQEHFRPIRANHTYDTRRCLQRAAGRRRRIRDSLRKVSDALPDYRF